MEKDYIKELDNDKLKRTITYTNEYFSIMTPDLENAIIQKYKKSDNISYNKYINFNVKNILAKYAPRGIQTAKGCSCSSNCCSNNCCGRSKIENILTCFFKNYSIIYYEPAKIDLSRFETIDDINFNNVEFTIYDNANGIPRLVLPFAIIFAYKTTGNFPTAGLTVDITISSFSGNFSVNNVINLNLPATSTIKYYTLMIPCLPTPAALGQNIQIIFRSTDDLNLYLTLAENDTARKVYCAVLYHVLAPMNIFSVRSLANSTLFYFNFREALVTNLLPSPGIYGGVFRIVEYMFAIMQAISNGIGASAITQISRLNANDLIILKSRLERYLEQLKRFIINTTYINASMIDDIDDYIINTGSNQILDLYILTATSYIENLQGLLALF